MRVNGLYGHVRHNDRRSLTLFAAFVAAFHVLALLGLIVPLGMFDPAHAPLSAPLGYVLRWVPIVTLVGALLFGAQLLWHVHAVRIRTAFRFVDDSDEPRLCRIVEPLAIAAGLPTPYVAVIETPVRNAFACGIRRNQAVLVFTRGLIAALDDEELAAVAAHEISHVANGDIRLVAAANICLASLNLIAPRTGAPRDQARLAMIMPVLMLITPLLFVIVVATLALRKLAIDGGQLTRRAIASSREFVADAQAVELTQNPAALVAALRRIEGHSWVPGLAAGQDAMMIDGPQDGPLATHPTIDQRVTAIVAVTGTMALVAPSRRDTRVGGLGGGFGRRRLADVSAPPAFVPVPAPTSVWTGRGEELNRLGMTREVSWGALLAVAVFCGLHFHELDRPGALLAAFSPAPLNVLLGAAGDGAGCEVDSVTGRHRLLPGGTRCDPENFKRGLKAHHGEPNLIGLLGGMADSFTPREQADGIDRTSNEQRPRADAPRPR